MDRKVIIQDLLKQFKTMKEIGNILGISRQRVYQLTTRYGLSSPERPRQGFWKTQTIPQQWLWNALKNKSISKIERWKIYQELKDKIPECCPILNLTLNFGEKSTGHREEESPSLDRIDSRKGYIVGNCHVVSWRANRIKNDGTAEELRKIANYLAQFDKT